MSYFRGTGADEAHQPTTKGDDVTVSTQSAGASVEQAQAVPPLPEGR